MGGKVLVTGASGYLGQHIARRLMEDGWTVRASVRSEAKGQALRQSLARASGAGAPGLEIVLLDLNSDAGWVEAAKGCDAVLHTASPFPMTQPKDPQEVIRPAVDGARRAIRAAFEAGVPRFVLTSSTVALSAPGQDRFDESTWTDPEDPETSPYGASKTLAERAVWDFAETTARDMAVTTVNPGFILGAPLGEDYGTSVAVVERLMRGRDPMVPRIGFTSVDVRDVAEVHLRALTMAETTGQRLVAVDRFLWFSDMAAVLREAFPDRRIPRREAPRLLLRLLALFDGAIASILPQVGQRHEVDNSRTRALLGMEFRDSRESLVETARALVEAGRV